MAIVTRKTDDQLNEWLKSVHTLLKSVDSDYIHPCSIPSVPEGLKESKEDVYMPRVVSIGPHNRERTGDIMEGIKLRCMLSLIHRRNAISAATSLEECSEAIAQLDEQVRASYVDHIKLDKHDLARIMLVDGCFLLELLISLGLNAQLPSRLIPPGPAPQLLNDEDVLSDLMLLENQIPILVLHKLSQLLFPNVFTNDVRQRATKINDLALSLLGYSLPRIRSLDSPHFLDLVHFSVNAKSEIQDTKHVAVISHVNLKLRRCATRLQAAGVNIIKQALQVRGSDFDISFSNGKLKIPQLHITQTTKAKWCNAIAWEHCIKNGKGSSNIAAAGNVRSTKFTSAALLFDGLICCAADVKLLKEKNVIADHLNMSNQDLKTFFRTISRGIDHRIVDPGCIRMFDELNKYSTVDCVIQSCTTMWHYYMEPCLDGQVEQLIKFMRRDYTLLVALSCPAVLTFLLTVYAKSLLEILFFKVF